MTSLIVLCICAPADIFRLIHRDIQLGEWLLRQMQRSSRLPLEGPSTREASVLLRIEICASFPSFLGVWAHKRYSKVLLSQLDSGVLVAIFKERKAPEASDGS